MVKLPVTGPVLALAFGVLLAAAVVPQDSDLGDRRAVRVHLKNGAILEGDSLRETARTVTLLVDSGEVVVSRETIDRIERVKLRPPPPAVLPPPKPAAPVPPQQAEDVVPPSTREKVDALLSQVPKASENRRHELLRELSRLVPSAAPHLVRRMEVVDEPTRAWIAAALLDARSAVQGRTLEPLLRSRRPEVRVEGARVLGAIGNPSAVPAVASLLRDPNPAVRSAAVQGLAALGTREAFRAIASSCADPNRDVRLHALQSLPRLAEKNDCREQLESALLDAFDATRDDARADVVSVMGISGRKALGRYLAEALRDESPFVRGAAATALMNLAAREWQGRIVDRFAREDHSMVRIALAGAAQNLHLYGAIDPLISWLSSADPNVAAAALRALRALTERDFGLDVERWTVWWEETRRNRP